MYVYKIENEETKEVYIGITDNFEKRISQHIRESRQERSKGRKLYKSILEYGIEKFNCKILEKTNDDSREKYWIEYYDSFNNGLNGTFDGKGNKNININRIITSSMIELAKEEYIKSGNLIFASKVSNIPIRKTKAILEENGVVITKKGRCKKSRLTEYDNMPFFKINIASDEIIEEYLNLKEYSKNTHKTTKLIVEILNGDKFQDRNYTYKWKKDI
jgi:hypothetical protein